MARAAITFAALVILWQCIDLFLHYCIGFITLPHLLANCFASFGAVTLIVLLVCMKAPPKDAIVVIAIVTWLIYVDRMVYFFEHAPDLWHEQKGPNAPVPPITVPVIILVAGTTLLGSIAAWKAASHADSVALL